MWMMIWMFGCGSPEVSSEPAPAPAPAPVAYWVERTDEQLDEHLRTTCEAAVEASQPVLLAFSAPWCIDCKKLRSLAEQPPAAAELEGWQKVVIDVGRFERHEALRHHFQVASIAYLVALRPTDCTQPVTAWPVLAKGPFEPVSRDDGVRTPEALATWLSAARSDG
jgi:thioredoxin-like negative regulator of GroEL